VLAEIRNSIRHGVPLGSERFTDQVERQLGRRMRLRKPGRKPKPAARGDLDALFRSCLV